MNQRDRPTPGKPSASVRAARRDAAGGAELTQRPSPSHCPRSALVRYAHRCLVYGGADLLMRASPALRQPHRHQSVWRWGTHPHPVSPCPAAASCPLWRPPSAHVAAAPRPDDLPCQPPPSPTQPLPPCPLRCPALSAPLSEPTATPSATLNAWPSASPTAALRELFRPPRSASSLSPALTRAQRHSHPLSRQMARGWRAAVPWRSAGPSSAW